MRVAESFKYDTPQLLSLQGNLGVDFFGTCRIAFEMSSNF